ncbi:MAG: hypothetical protein EBU88_16335 [Acidobacteria bacterium]|nr:hypothetical protein [Acidobacteriota bacterium]
MQQTDSAREALPILQMQLDYAGLTDAWEHCDQVANFLGRLGSSNRGDSQMHANLLSTVLNELFEILYWKASGTGLVRCALYQDGDSDFIEVEIPARDTDIGFYEAAVAAARSKDAEDVYLRTLVNDMPDHSIGLLELAADYGAEIALASDVQTHSLRLTVHVCLTGVSNEAMPS